MKKINIKSVDNGIITNEQSNYNFSGLVEVPNNLLVQLRKKMKKTIQSLVNWRLCDGDYSKNKLFNQFNLLKIVKKICNIFKINLRDGKN